MFKKIFFYFVFIIIAITLFFKFSHFVNNKIKNSYQNNLKLETISPENTIFAFDLHEVVVHKKTLQMFKSLFLFPRQYLHYLIYPNIWNYIYRFSKKIESGGQVYDDLIKKFPELSILKPLFIKIINLQELDLNVIKIIQILNKCGYKVFILSNVWESVYLDLINKFPVMKSLFVDYFIPGKTTNNYYKPDIRFYYDFKNYLQDKDLTWKKIIFIDDKLENIKTANSAGLIGIPFTNSEELLNLLHKWNIKCLV